MDKSQDSYAEEKKPDIKDIVYDFVYIKSVKCKLTHKD